MGQKHVKDRVHRLKETFDAAKAKNTSYSYNNPTRGSYDESIASVQNVQAFPKEAVKSGSPLMKKTGYNLR